MTSSKIIEVAEEAYATGADHLTWRRYDDQPDEDIRTISDGKVVFTGDADECWDYMHRERLKAALTAYESHLQASGMAVVPVEPTPAMLASVRWDEDDARSGWECMLSACPNIKAPDREG